MDARWYEILKRPVYKYYPGDIVIGPGLYELQGLFFVGRCIEKKFGTTDHPFLYLHSTGEWLPEIRKSSGYFPSFADAAKAAGVDLNAEITECAPSKEN